MNEIEEERERRPFPPPVPRDATGWKICLSPSPPSPPPPAQAHGFVPYLAGWVEMVSEAKTTECPLPGSPRFGWISEARRGEVDGRSVRRDEQGIAYHNSQTCQTKKEPWRGSPRHKDVYITIDHRGLVVGAGAPPLLSLLTPFSLTSHSSSVIEFAATRFHPSTRGSLQTDLPFPQPPPSTWVLNPAHPLTHPPTH